MKVLIIGSGGREHAICNKLLSDDKKTQIFIASNNNALEDIATVINLDSVTELSQFAQDNTIDLTIVGSEELLVHGIVDEFKKHNLKIIGADKQSAQLEGSKDFAKKFMNKYNIRTADYQTFENENQAITYVKEQNKFPIVIKFDGLALGKGVKIPNNLDEATLALNECFKNHDKVVIEEFLTGFEISILSLYDGKNIIPLISSKDHKKALNDDKGENTGGMGSIAPHPLYDDKLEQDFMENILNPTLTGLKAEKLLFAGIIFFGLMVANDKIYLLEYNIRMGDPETQSILPLMNNNLVDTLNSCLDQELENLNISWADGYSSCVVLASNGYPASYKKGFNITIAKNLDSQILLAGVKRENKQLLTNGGRVLNVVNQKPTLQETMTQIYQDIENIDFSNKTYRTDIGKS